MSDQGPVERLRCGTCSKTVSTEFRAVATQTPDRGLILRAGIECPECFEKRTTGLEKVIAHWRVRRQAWFDLYYHCKNPREVSSEDSKATWNALAEYDNVLNDLQQIGLVPAFWQNNPPSIEGDNGGFSEDFLRRSLKRTAHSYPKAK
jgi:DNA-directed RNA polymerase subunit RPC12/RpoP